VIVLQERVAADKEKVKVWEDTIVTAQNAVIAMKDSQSAAIRASESYRDIADYLNVYAPFDGYITERNMHVGSFVGPLGKGAYPAIVRIQELDLLRIVTPVPEANVAGVLPGAPVEFTVSTHPGEKFKGTVARIGNALEQKTRTMPVELNYLNDKWRILPGMFCQVYWPTRRREPSLFLPPSAVETTSTLSTFVCRVNGDETEWVLVARGEMMDGLTEVFGNLQEGDLVALRCTDALKPHTRVKAIVAAAAAEENRPGYNGHGTIYTTPDAERADLNQPQNSNKPKAY
jgi:RND family efflux transporter MFP subunit